MNARFKLLSALFVIVFATIQSHAKDKKEEPPKGPKTLAETVGDAQKIDGLLTFYKGDDKLWLALRVDQLDKEYGFTTTRIKAAGDFAARDSSLNNTDLVKWKLVGDHVVLEKQNTHFRADPSSTMYHAVRNTFPHSPVFSAKRIKIKEDNVILIDAGKLFGADLNSIMSPQSGWNPGGPPIMEQLKSFPDNAWARMMFRFKGPNKPVSQEGFARFMAPNNLADSRFMEIWVDFNFFRLPEDGYRARRADKRVGSFPLSFKDYSDVEAEDTAFRHIMLRWDLRKKNPKAKISEPVTPVVFYIDHSVPQKWRPLIHDTAAWWNVSFEKIGLKNAIQIKDQPDDPEFDPNDIRNSMIYWNLTDDLVFSGMAGPSVYDPRNGKVLKANVYINGEFPSFALHRYLVYSWWRAPEPGMELFDRELREEMRQRRFLSHQCDRQASFSSQIAFARLVLRARGQLESSPEEAERFAREAFLELVAHEIGHALGFPHNWKASLASKWEDVRDGKVTGRVSQNIMSSSVMDYNPIYLAPKGQEQGDFFMQECGQFDDLFVEYIYKPLDHLSPAEEAVELDRIAAKAETEYGMVFDGGELNHIDPTTNSDDFGDDPLSFAESRLVMLQEEVLPVLPKLVLEEGHDYNLLRQALDSAIFSVAMDYVDMTARFVGGQELLRRVAGSKGAKAGGPPPITPVSPEKQRQALEILDQRLFEPGLYHLSKETLAQLEADLHYDWNYPWRYASDYNIDTRIAGLYQSALDTLLAPDRMARILDNENRYSGEPFTLLEMMEHLYQTAFGGVEVVPEEGASEEEAEEELPSDLHSDRRALQRLLVKAWLKLAIEPPKGTPPMASQIAVMHSLRLAESIEADDFEGYDQPHYLDLKLRIEMALDD